MQGLGFAVPQSTGPCAPNGDDGRQTKADFVAKRLMPLLPGVWQKLRTVWVGQVFVSPESGAKLLAETNTSNRTFISRNLTVLTRAVEAGSFYLTGETVIWNWDGVLVNGQHRLEAAARAGTGIETLVVVGVNPDVFVAIDQGFKRQLSESLARLNYQNPKLLASSLTQVCNFFVRGYLGHYGRVCQTIEEHLADARRHDGLSASVARFATFRKRCMFGGPAIMSSLHYIFAQVDRDLADRFFDMALSLRIPEDTRWDAMRALVQRLTADSGRLRSGKDKLDQVYICALAVKAWNSVYSDKPLRFLRWSNEEHFPRVAGWEYDGQLPVSPVSRETARTGARA